MTNVLEVAAGVLLGNLVLSLTITFGTGFMRKRAQAKKIAELDAYYDKLLQDELASEVKAAQSDDPA